MMKGNAGRPRRVITGGLERLLAAVFTLTGLILIDTLYLSAVDLYEWLTGASLENRPYLLAFLAHLVLGLLLTPPAVLFGALHLRRAWAWRRVNRYAVGAGLALYLSVLLLLGSGILLTRFGFFEIDDPGLRSLLWWIHIATPVLVAWLFVLHRLAGPPLRWRPGLAWGGAALAVTAIALALHLLVPARATDLDRHFLPALAVSPAGIPAERLSTDAACGECHADVLEQHAHSAHRFSSFSNPVYRFSVEETRRFLKARDGETTVARLCAGCHDPVLLFSGRFDDPDFDPDRDPHAGDGITCLACHAITGINGPLGNGDYRIEPPPAYPFADSSNPLLRAIGNQLIKARPSLHKRSLMHPVLRSAEFCSACHKVHLPKALNGYRWLRGQDHYDSFLLSGVSGHRVDSFYYPARAVDRCARCHMPPRDAADPAARDLDGDGVREVHDHLFPAANTALPAFTGTDSSANRQREAMLRKAARVDLFGLRMGSETDAPLLAPLRPQLPVLSPGRTYLIEAVVRTVGMGHAFTQGTADSNEPWLEMVVREGDRILARSGGLTPDGDVDPWAYFLNSYLLDRNGHRIERRNAQDIFVALYNHQIPPGAASVVHYRFTVPKDVHGPLTLELKLHYRKFDTRLMRHVRGASFTRNDLPIVTLAEDRVILPTAPDQAVPDQDRGLPAWERWNDYGIGLLRAGNRGANRGELRQAEAAFREVEKLGRPDGPLNLARALYKEGRLDAAAEALARAASHSPPAPPWTLAWFSALIEHERGNPDAAIAHLERLVRNDLPGARERGFDFSRDYRMRNRLGRILYERARRERGAARQEARRAFLERARNEFEAVLREDPENATAHYNLALVHAELGDTEAARRHHALHEKYRPDDEAIEQAVTAARRRDPAANHAAEPVAVYELRPPAGQDPSVTGGQDA